MAFLEMEGMELDGDGSDDSLLAASQEIGIYDSPGNSVDLD